MQMCMMYIGMCDVCTVVRSRILGRGKVYSYKHRKGCFPSHDSKGLGWLWVVRFWPRSKTLYFEITLNT